MNKNVKSIIFVLPALVIFLHSCYHSTEPEQPEPKIPYMSLNIGDIRQYYDIATGQYSQVEVINTTNRVDGQEVYVVENITYYANVKWIGYTYHFIRDNYFWQTYLDTVKEPTINSVNPFLESKIINTYDNGNEYFLRTDGVADSERVFHESKIIDSVETSLQTFYDVLEINQIDPDTTNNRRMYYAKEYGLIETRMIYHNEIYILSPIYVKVKDKEIGQYVLLP
ncbi:MAG: hypothetical protein JW995_05140 [Melioribacteraceae bacterium]|nr:hypothetical protein [Melioribacteraceae bacterium]